MVLDFSLGCKVKFSTSEYWWQKNMMWLSIKDTNNLKVGSGTVALQVNPPFEAQASHMGTSLCPSAPLLIQFSAYSLRKQRRIAWNPAPIWKTWSSWPLVLDWLSCSHYGHLSSDPADRTFSLTLPLSLSLFLSHTTHVHFLCPFL